MCAEPYASSERRTELTVVHALAVIEAGGCARARAGSLRVDRERRLTRAGIELSFYCWPVKSACLRRPCSSLRASEARQHVTMHALGAERAGGTVVKVWLPPETLESFTDL